MAQCPASLLGVHDQAEAGQLLVVVVAGRVAVQREARERVARGLGRARHERDQPLVGRGDARQHRRAREQEGIAT